MISAAIWRTYTALALLTFTSVGLIAALFLPVLMSQQVRLPLWNAFIFHPILGLVGVVVLLTLLVLAASSLVRLMNLNLNTLLIRNTPITPIISLLGLGTGDLEAETTRLNLVLTGLLLG